MDSNFLYFALKLNDATHKELTRQIQENSKNLFPEIKDRKVILWYLDHLTLFHCSAFKEESREEKNEYIYKALEKEFEEQKGRLYTIKIVGYGISDKAFALKCEVIRSIPIKNKIPHITVCTFDGAKPVESNNIKDWYQFQEKDCIYVTGYMIKVVKDVDLEKQFLKLNI